MLRISNIKYPLENELNIEELKIRTAKFLNTIPENIKSLKINKKSIDAREKLGGFYVLTVDIEIINEKKYLKLKNVEKIEPFLYEIPKKHFRKSPIIIGFGPSGLMAALILARSGAKPIV